MVKKVIDPKRQHQRGIMHRPLDFYAAFLIFFFGIYGFLDPSWPERYGTLTFWIITVEDIYLMGSATMIMVSLAMQTCKTYPIQAIALEMFGWLFVSAAAAVIALSSAWFPTSAFDQDSFVIDIAWIILWVGLSAASYVRWWSMRRLIKEGAVRNRG